LHSLRHTTQREKTAGRSISLETMLRTHFLPPWFTLSDPATEEAFFDVPLYREFAQQSEFTRLPDESKQTGNVC
jgi:IS5 family transposase